jgi:ATP-dependent protease Clp ATPase subunit
LDLGAEGRLAEKGPDMSDITCSFCCKTYSNDEAKARMVAGPEVFICRDCVDICVQVFMKNAAWRDAKIQQLIDRRDAQISN